MENLMQETVERVEGFHWSTCTTLILLTTVVGLFSPASSTGVTADAYAGLTDEVTDIIQAEAGTPIPRIIELHQVLEKSGRAALICASLISDARFDGRVTMRVIFQTPSGEPVESARFRFTVNNRGEDGSSGSKCVRPNGIVVPEMTVATYRFKIRGRLIRRSASQIPSNGAVPTQFIGVQGIFERHQIHTIE